MSLTTANTDQIHPGAIYSGFARIDSNTGTTEQPLIASADNPDGMRIDSITADYDADAAISVRFLIKKSGGALHRQGVVEVTAGAGSSKDKPALDLLALWRGSKRAIGPGHELYVQTLTGVPAGKSLHITLDGGAF